MHTEEAVEAQVAATKRQFLFLNTAEYFLAGFFWLFAMVGGSLIDPEDRSYGFFSSIFVLFLSNGLWEVLTGWYADKFRRQFSITAGFFWYGIGFIVMIIAVNLDVKNGSSLAFWLAGITLWSLGPAMLSGAKESWLVDRCSYFSSKSKEKLGETFTRAAILGVIFKALGGAYAFGAFVLTGLVPSSSVVKDLGPSFLVAAGPPAIVALLLCFRSTRLQEEYWIRPEYHTSENLLSFLFSACAQVVRSPYVWFTVGFASMVVLNYVLSATLWPYFIIRSSQSNIAWLVAGVLAVEVLAGLLGKRAWDSMKDAPPSSGRIPILAFCHIVPLLLVLFDLPFSVALGVAVLIFRSTQGIALGSLANLGHRAIKADHQRALMYSISSAFAAFVLAIPAGLFMARDRLSLQSTEFLQRNIELFWFVVVPPVVLFAAVGSYLAAASARSKKVQ